MKNLSLLALALLSTSLLACGPKGETGTGVVASSTPAPAATSAPGPAPKLNAGQIKAGVGIKEVSLGQPKAEVVKVLGEPEEIDANEFAPGQTYALYYSKGIELSYSNDKLDMITLHAPPEPKWTAPYSGATEQGFGVGSPAEDIVKALGEPEAGMARALRYPKLGIWFRLDGERGEAGKSPKVESVQIMKPE